MSLLDLPTELLISVLEYADVWEWKQVRQTCRSLSGLATPLLFEEINFELCEHGCESLYNISQNSVLNCFVKTIALRRIRGYRKFADFDAWVKGIHQPGTPDYIPWKTCYTTYYEDEELRSQLMPYEEWARLSKEEKNALYEAYNADRELQNKDAQSIANAEAGNVSVTQFSKALKTLPNLRAFEHEPRFLDTDTWALRWRDLYFHPDYIAGFTNNDEDGDIDALQLSIVLERLAYFRGKGQRLQKMSMYIGGPAFATPARLKLLRLSGSHKITRLCRSIHATSPEADADARTGLVESDEIKLLYRRLQAMACAFSDLTCLDCSVSDNDEMTGCMETAAKLVLCSLISATKLQKLSLAFGRLVDGYLRPTLHSRWNQICSVELEIATDRKTLMGFLLAHKDTLRCLTLVPTSLVRLGDYRNTWEPTLTEIGQCLCLEFLSLSTLCDTIHDWAPGVCRRMMFDVKDNVWQSKESELEAYHSAVVARVLRGEVIDSLQPHI
ncbi:F-box domain protein [Bipolaris maydis]|uniref:F-box domain protein n=1 Tax=Cochliobolus heterostrophus TaxID=5016 RepID=UPI0024DDD394|nr:F-box domain protein [Bipolaris maydis]